MMSSSIRYAENDGRPLPVENPTTKPYFDAAKEHRLSLQRCPRDGYFFYPRTHCPECMGDDWEWQDVSGLGEVHAFTVDRVGHDPAFAPHVPLVIAVVELEEGPRMTANLSGCNPEEVRVGMSVEVTFEDLDGHTLIHFRPRSA